MESRSRKQTSVWGGLLILFGVMGLVQAYTDLTAWVWVAILAATGLGVFGVYLTDRSEWALLIQAYAMWAIAGLVALITLRILRGSFIPTYVLAAIALAFLVVFLRNREQWWALVPAYVLLSVGVMVGLTGQGVLSELFIPAYVMFAIAIPFFVVYARAPRQWWALIPGGIMAVIGLSFLAAEGMFQYIAAAALLLAGVWIVVRQFTHREPAAPGPGADESSVE